MDEREQVDFAFKYPFSNEAVALVGKIPATDIQTNNLRLAFKQIETAANKGFAYSYTGLDSLKRELVLVYVHSRMLLSALGDPWLIERYADSVASRAVGALLSDLDRRDLPLLFEELGITVSRIGGWEFRLGVFDFLGSHNNFADFGLVNLRLSQGEVTLDFDKTVKFARILIKKKVMSGLPIPKNALPKYVVDFAKTVRPQLPKNIDNVGKPGTDKINWIDELLAKPIIDGRHRVVNLVLAPYLVNVKGIPLEEAVKIIMQYIERCKQVNPDTKVNEQYITYQCKYAEKRGSKPLSKMRAKEFLTIWD
jgi:hypothetical protein